MGDNTNQEQIEFWNRLGQRWVTYQENLDVVWRSLGEAAFECAGVLAGERVVDVGCGCGATALELAAKVAQSGSVIGIDVSAPMLARARERAQKLSITNLQFTQADASNCQFQGGADLVFSRFGVMFFADPVAAFSNLRRALRPEGRLVFVCFRDRELNSWWTVPLAAAATVVPPEPPTPANEAGPFSLADETRLRAVLASSGFVGIVCEPLDHNLVLGTDVDLATDFCLNAGPASRAVADATDETRANVRAMIRQALATHAGSAGVSLRAATWIVTAINPLDARTER